MADVFISYKRESRLVVETLSALLIDLKLSVWFDASLVSGSRWRDVIRDEAENASTILVCWTPLALASQPVREEVDIALRRGVLAQTKVEPIFDLPPDCRDFHVANLVDWSGDPGDAEFQSLLQQIETLTGKTNLARNARLRAGGQHDELVSILRALLVARARARSAPYTYAEAEQAVREGAALEGIQIGEFDQYSLWGALDAIADQNRRHREPPLFALVVSPRNGLPGRGYFQKHAFLEGHLDQLERQVFEKHLQRVYRNSWPRDP